jgi:hypothetical protein
VTLLDLQSNQTKYGAPTMAVTSPTGTCAGAMTVPPRVSATLTSGAEAGGDRDDERVTAADQGPRDVWRDQADEHGHAHGGHRRRCRSDRPGR